MTAGERSIRASGKVPAGALFIVSGVLCLSLLAGAPAAGQLLAQDPETRVKSEAEEEVRQVEESGEATDESRTVTGVPDELSFRDVLQRPDDVQLNLAFAKIQIARGNYNGATATLQRVLLLKPDEAQVRVLLGIVLLRLGDLQRAELELERALDAEKLSAGLRRKAESALEQVRQRQKRTRFTLSTSAGVRYDDNRNQAPESGQSLFLGVPVSADARNGDTNAFAILRGGVEHEIDERGVRILEAEATYYGSDQVEVDSLDLQLLGLETGVRFDEGEIQFKPFVAADYIELGGENYLYDAGAGARLEYRPAPAFEFRFLAKSVYEDFVNSDVSPTADRRTGWRTTAEAGLEWRIDPKLILNAAVGAQHKEAEADFESYDAASFKFGPVLLLGRGQFLSARASVARRSYEEPDRFISPETRRDTVYQARLSYGVPVATLTGEAVALPDWLSKTRLTLSYEYQSADSNIRNFEYDSNRVQMLLTRGFSF